MPTLVELKNMCKRKGIKGYSKLNKKQLEKLVKKAPKKKAPKKKAPKKKAPKKKVTKGGSDFLHLQKKNKGKVLVNTYAVRIKKGDVMSGYFNVIIEISPNPENLGEGFPVWKGLAQMSQFPFKQEYIDKFQSYVDSSLTPMDCFINACQLIGILDTLNANILRISCAGKTGFNLNAMEKIFTLKSASDDDSLRSLQNLQIRSSDGDTDGDMTMGNNTVQYYNFTDLNKLGGGLTLFAHILKKNLLKGHAAFCGWMQTGGGHVFIISKDSQGKLWYLDPQQTGSPCILDNNQDCQNILQKNTKQDRKYYILYNTHNTQNPIPINILKDLGFDLSAGRSAHTQGTVFNNNNNNNNNWKDYWKLS